MYNLPDKKTELTEEDIPRMVDNYLQTAPRIRVGGLLEAKHSKIDDRQIRIGTTENIQAALDTLNKAGGGVLHLGAGTYTVNSALIGYSSITIEGVSPSATILDFNSTSANLSFAGTSVYTTGTISSITGGVNVTGSGTAWLANASAGQYLFIGTRHYKIAAVTSNTALILSEGYADDVTFPSNYRISSVIVDVKLINFSVKNSTGTGIAFTDAAQITIDNVISTLNNKGFSFINVSRLNADRCLAASSTSNGYEFTNIGQSDWESVNATSNGGHGFVFNNVKTVSSLLSSVANTGDGFNVTDCTQLQLIIETKSNGGQGLEMVSGCSDIEIDGIIASNTSDGIKLTATSDRNKLTGIYKNNGGYGVNIAISSCDNNTIIGGIFSSNTSGAINDSGTDTVIVGNSPNSINTGQTHNILSSTHSDTTTASAIRGDIITAQGASPKWARLAVGTSTQVLHGGTEPSYSAVVEADISLSDNTTNDVSTTKHGLVPKAPNDTTKFLRGDATWVVPPTTSYANGIATRSGNTASGTQTIAHGLGATPNLVRINTIKNDNTAGQLISSTGSYNGTTTSCIFWATGNRTAANDSTNMVVIKDNVDTTKQEATISVDATNITLTWTKTGTPSNDTINLLWEAQK